VSEEKYPDDRPMYRLGIRTADEMFGEVVAMLERKGALDNAIVVILSDHGEALALPTDTIVSNESKIEGLRAPLITMDLGHGQSVISPVQYQVLLAFRPLRPRRF
jgi:arylsulfatase A-like enzyme